MNSSHNQAKRPMILQMHKAEEALNFSFQGCHSLSPEASLPGGSGSQCNFLSRSS